MNESSDFSTCRLEKTAFRRASRVAPKFRRDGYESGFDATTLWFDAVWHNGLVTLICPRLNNLAALFGRGKVMLDAQAVKPKVRMYYRHSTVTLKCASRPERISLEIDGFRLETRVRFATPERFRGRNAIVTMSKGNDLRWIEDFARFHARTQGAESILFIDNGSTTYAMSEIQGVLERAGLDALVLRTELPFGPRGLKPYSNSELYLQTCALNAVRLRYLQEARAVLFCDIDELVLSRGAKTVFDAAARAAFGYTRFSGTWRYAVEEGDTALVRHADHVFRKPGETSCPHKWCVRPGGPVGQAQWRPHTLEGFPFNWMFDSKDFTFHHCRQITTGWKRNSALSDQTHLVEDVSAGALARDRQRDVVRPRPTDGPLGRLLGRAAETASRYFFGLSVVRQLATAAFMLCCFSIVLEEALDNDPPGREIAALLKTVQRVSEIDPF